MSIVVVGTVQSNSSSPPTIQNTSGTEIGTFCRAWVNFNGTTVTNPASMTGVRGSFNVSSILDNGTGDYTVNFTTAMSDENYSTVCTGAQIAATQYASSTGSIRLLSFARTDAFTYVDSTYFNVAVFR